jgi:hypothetical protein
MLVTQRHLLPKGTCGKLDATDAADLESTTADNDTAAGDNDDDDNGDSELE